MLMKKFFFLAAAFCFTALANAQVAQVGFEDGDTQYTTKYALTPGGLFGDWVNKDAHDTWQEPSNEDAHTGEYCFYMNQFAGGSSNTWDRGFKVGNLPLEDGTSYRVSFWVKASETAKISANLGIGIEYADAPIAASGNIAYTNDFSGFNLDEWKHISFMTYFVDKATIDEFFTDHVTSDDYKAKYETASIDINDLAEYYDNSVFPPLYFLTINSYTSNAKYFLDDILVEKAMVNSPVFGTTAVRLDWGYPTNVKSLATNSATGTLVLDPSCVTITRNGEPVTIEYLEGKSADGYIYAFLPDGESLDPEDEIVVSFTRPADIDIKYTYVKRPSSNTTDDMNVVDFAGEKAYFDESVDEVFPATWDPAEMVSSDPEDQSFELDAATLTSISVTYNKKIDISTASARLELNALPVADLSNNMSVSADGYTIITTFGDFKLDNTEYDFVLSDVCNEYGIPCTSEQKINFQVGEDTDESQSEVVYQSDFDNDMTGGVPQGWLTKSLDSSGNEVVHKYAFNEDGSQYNYNWGGTPGGGGARLYDGFSGDFVKAFYWCSRDGADLGYCSYGELVNDYLLPDGSLDPDAPEGIALRLEPKKHQVSFLMAAWKSEPKFNFTLEDLQGNVYARFDEILAQPNVNGAQGYVSGSVVCTTKFSVPEEGYYILKFTEATKSAWQEFLLANVKLITMPSNAAYWKQMLREAADSCEIVLNSAADAAYDGTTKTALTDAIQAARTGKFHCGGDVTEAINNLYALAAALQTRMSNIDNFDIAIIEAQTAMIEIEGTKYEQTEEYITAKDLVNLYINTNPSTLEDEELNNVAPLLVSAAAKLANAKSVADLLSFRAYKAATTARTLGVDEAIVNEGLNKVTDDDAYIATANKAIKDRLTDLILGAGIPDSMKVDYCDDQDTTVVVAHGVDMSYVTKNAKFYATYPANPDASYGLMSYPIIGWTATTDNVHYNGTAPTADCRATDVMANAYKPGTAGGYELYQTLRGLVPGTYTFVLCSRTATKTRYTLESEAETYALNGQLEETGEWDKYIYVEIDGERMVQPFAAGAWGTHTSAIQNVKVEHDAEVTIGYHEDYVSLSNFWDADGNNMGEDQGEWDTNTFMDNVYVYLLEGDATGIEDVTSKTEGNLQVKQEIFNLAGQRVNTLTQGLNIVGGKKVLVK